jgi:putative ABC transport system permease protein
MIPGASLLPLVRRQLVRQPLRTGLTLSGVAVAMFLFCAVEAMRAGVERATTVTSSDTLLVVYRENRYCPFTSRIPQYYGDRIEAIPGVVSVVPMQITVSNCRASLDVVTLRGVPEEDFVAEVAPGLRIIEGSLEEWRRRSDAALVGESLAKRRRVAIGDRLDAAGITVTVAGVLRSAEPQEQNVAYTHLAFLQESLRRGGTGGIVTQFNVRVGSAADLEPVAAAIDEEFARDTEPTSTRPEKAFVAAAARDILEIVRFASWLGWGALAAVFALVANAIVLAVRDRVREHAILETVGFAPRHIAAIVLLEGLHLGIAGGLVGAVAAFLVARQLFALTMEGINIEIVSDPRLIATGLLLAVLLGLGAAVAPALRAARRSIAESFRAV